MSPYDAQQGLKTGEESGVLESLSDPQQENRWCAVRHLRLRRRRSPTTFSEGTEAEWVATIGIPEAHHFTRKWLWRNMALLVRVLVSAGVLF